MVGIRDSSRFSFCTWNYIKLIECVREILPLQCIAFIALPLGGYCCSYIDSSLQGSVGSSPDSAERDRRVSDLMLVKQSANSP